jgi:HAE1 family hydrophobic/amphiphilic exporter-1
MEKTMSLMRHVNRAARRSAAVLPAAGLAAFLAFGNAVSVYGQGSARTGSASAPPFKRVGEPFLVLEAEQTQTPAPRSPATQTPAQRDAQRPPGREQQSPVPPQGRPTTADPRLPPDSQRQSPEAPPGSQLPPTQQTTAPAPQLPAQGAEPSPAASPAPATDPALADPTFPVVEPRPVPPMPTLSRVGVTASDTLPLSLNEAIRRALENNNEIEVARADVRLAESFLNSLQGAYDHVLLFTPQYRNQVRPTASSLGGADRSGTVSTSDFIFDNRVTKLVDFWGGSYDVFFNNNRTNTSSTFNTLNPVYSSVIGVTYTQPLWRDRTIDNTRRQIRIQRKRLQQSDADFRRRTTEVISQVQRAYWDLVFAIRDEQNQVANLNLARENFRRTEASVAAGAVAPLQRAEVQTELSNREAALLAASQQVTFAENTLKNLLLRDPLAPEWTRALVPTDEATAADAQPVSLQEALTEARANRPELRRLNLQGEVNAIDLEYFRNQTKPRIDVSGTFSTNGLAGAVREGTNICSGNEQPNDPACLPSEFSGGYGQTLSNLFKLKTRDVVVGVTIQLPLRNRTAEANLATARIERDQLAAQTRAQEQAVEVEVRNAVQAVETARLRVLSARQARVSAEEQLAGERRLYQVGRSTTFLLFQRENALVNARNQELRAETDYNIARAELQRATSTTLRANNVLIESPVTGKFEK